MAFSGLRFQCETVIKMNRNTSVTVNRFLTQFLDENLFSNHILKLSWFYPVARVSIKKSGIGP